MARPIVHHLPREAVIEAALACGLPAERMEARNHAGRGYKVELLSPWGWQTPYPEKAAKGRAIADKLGAAGYVCAFDVLDTGGFDAIFELADPLAVPCRKCRAPANKPCRNYKGQNKQTCPDRGTPAPAPAPGQPELF